MIEASVVSAICGAGSFLLNIRNTYNKDREESHNIETFDHPTLFTMNNFRGSLARICADYYRNGGYRILEIEEQSLPLIIGTNDTEWIISNLGAEIDIVLDWEENTVGVDPIYPGLVDKVSQKFGKKIDDNPTYRLLSVERNKSQLKLCCGPGLYRSYYETCEGLSWETAEDISALITTNSFNNIVDNAEGAIRQLLENKEVLFELRHNIKPEEFTNRDSTIGVNTLTILASNEKESAFIIHKREGHISEAIGTNHVVPAGTFQPICNDQYHHNIEFSIERTILRESAEELLNLEDYIRQHSTMEPEYVFKNNEQLANLKELYDVGFIKTYKAGFALDPLTLKPEFLSIQIINWDIFKDYFPTFEFNWEGKGKLYELKKDIVRKVMLGDGTLPACAGCLAIVLNNWDYFIAAIQAD